MTADFGSVEPVDASELTAEHDDLEHWLHGIRTELTDNPSDWLATGGPGNDGPVPDYDGPVPDYDGPVPDYDGPVPDYVPAPAPAEAVAPAEDGDPGFAPTPEVRVGRHRAED